MPAPAQSSLLDIVNLVARSVGHPVAVDIPSSTDEAILRLAFYANQAGGELAYMFNWDWLTKEGTISVIATVPGESQKAFDLPTDYHAFVDDTHWARNSQMPAIGPVNSQDWQWLIVRNTKITTRLMWRIRNKQLWIKSPPTIAEPLTFEYISKNWAMDVDGITAKDYMTNSGDYHLYPWQLMVLFTRAKWFENEGYDSTAAYSSFQRAFQYETGVDKGATALALVPGQGFPYIDAIKNIPDTGYGLGS